MEKRTSPAGQAGSKQVEGQSGRSERSGFAAELEWTTLPAQHLRGSKGMASLTSMAPSREQAVVATPVADSGSARLWGFAALLGAFSLTSFLCCHNIADGDLWAKLAL